MRKAMWIFGTGEIARLAKFYFTTDSSYRVMGFTVDGKFVKSKLLEGLPVVPFEDFVFQYPPNKWPLFIALGYSDVNRLRKNKYLHLKSLGYSLLNYISSRAHVLNNGLIGDNCFILENTVIQPRVSVGNNVTVWSGSQVCHHTVIHDHCFFASGVIVSGGANIGESCFIGANATIRDHITVGKKCIIGAGALILANAGAEGVYAGVATPRSKFSSGHLRRI